ncbi:MAG: antibiotic biosynthesis monooxygenase [Alphaproteobacteria bacterium]|nr:antibiotic biosynthesis monooxygenase [Alphaproteobacteria bacterium]
MYGRITRFEVIRGKEEELANGYREQIKRLKGQKGFKDAILLVDDASGSVVSLTLWETKEEMDATLVPGGFVEQVLPLISPYQQTKPVFTTFKVQARASET